MSYNMQGNGDHSMVVLALVSVALAAGVLAIVAAVVYAMS